MTVMADGSQHPDLTDWLRQGVACGASDLHLVPGHPPMLRRHGELQAVGDAPVDSQYLLDTLKQLPTAQQWDEFQSSHNLDFSWRLTWDHTAYRFRVNFFRAGQDCGACFRIIPPEIPSFDWAGFPQPLAETLTGFRNGLVLIAGVTGAGKTTTLAMLIDRLNQRGGKRIITIEEPIEYMFTRREHSVVTQREVGTDVASFADGLKYGLRQDPDVILVGEIRDCETAQIALSAAETGHLVFSTLHTRDAKGAISRYTDLFAQSVQDEIRSQLSMSLRAVVSQHLLPSNAPDSKRELALEVMFPNSPIAHAIRSGRLETIDNNILTGKAAGMMTLDESVKRLLQEGKITQEVAGNFLQDGRHRTR